MGVRFKLNSLGNARDDIDVDDAIIPLEHIHGVFLLSFRTQFPIHDNAFLHTT